MPDALRLLFAAAADGLSNAELQDLARAGSVAAQQARWAADLAQSVGCLAADDKQVGAYHDGASVADLMFHLGACFEAVAALSDLGQSAAAEIAKRPK